MMGFAFDDLLEVWEKRSCGCVVCEYGDEWLP